MSDGLNALFKTQKSVFLQNNIVSVMGLLSEAVQPGHDDTVVNFDLRRKQTATGVPLVEVLPFLQRAHAQSATRLRLKAPTWKSNRVKAYWLRWRASKTVSMTLDDEADYFFTSELGGCQVVAVGAPGGTVHVAHIAGNQPPAWRAQEANTFAAGRAARRLSSTGASGTVPGYQPNNSNVAWANVFGFRTKPLIGAQSWQLWYQVVENQNGGAQLSIHTCTRLYP